MFFLPKPFPPLTISTQTRIEKRITKKRQLHVIHATFLSFPEKANATFPAASGARGNQPGSVGDADGDPVIGELLDTSLTSDNSCLQDSLFPSVRSPLSFIRLPVLPLFLYPCHVPFSLLETPPSFSLSLFPPFLPFSPSSPSQYPPLSSSPTPITSFSPPPFPPSPPPSPSSS